MARSCPEQIGESYFMKDNGEIDRYEWAVFCTLRSKLPSDWVILPRVRWAISRTTGDSRGECDFLVINPRRGILDLEVKSGVDWDLVTGYTQSHGPVDPIQQAERNRTAITKLLERNGISIHLGYVLIFPDRLKVGGPALVARRTFTEEDLEADDFPLRMNQAFDSWTLNSPLHTRLIDQVTSILTPWFGPSVSERKQIGKYVEGKLEEATAKQYDTLRAILDIDGKHRRVAVSGCAGSGKTRIAIEAAHSCASGGFSVLLLCFNNNLETILELEPRLRDYSGKSLEIRTFNSLADHLLTLANARRNREGLPALTKPRDWNNRNYVRDFAAAVDEVGLRYDVIIIDEGQDFETTWMMGITKLLKHPDTGKLVFLYDAFQALYPLHFDPDEIIRGNQFTRTKKLTTNCRNPAPIHRAAVQYHPDGEEFIPLVDDGLPPHRIELPLPSGSGTPLWQSYRAQVSALGKWLESERPSAKSVVLLAPHGSGQPRVKMWSDNSHSTEVGGYIITENLKEWIDPKNDKYILLCTTRKFKGLEAQHVVLIELDGINQDERARLLYTSMTRAKYQLVYLLPKGLKI